MQQRLDATAQRVVALTAPEGQYLRFHGLRLPALVDEVKQQTAGCGPLIRKPQYGSGSGHDAWC